MSTKRSLSPESNGDLRSLKRLKLHSIIQELQNEEANLVILKKLRACQQFIARTNATTVPTKPTTTTTTTNGFHPTATRTAINKSALPVPSVNSLSRSSLQPQQALSSSSSATRKPMTPINPPVITKIPPAASIKASSPSSTFSLEERKTQAKKSLRHQLERDLLNIPSPKPLLQDINFIPNPTSLEFQPYIGLEDVVQCLYELQTDRHRLPQRFTDRAHVDEPHICDHCGTDFTIRWWKHLNTSNSARTNILCDRCKKQVTRRTLKSDHSTLLKNVFVSAMEQEKEIEKNFQTLMKQQQKSAARPTSSSSSSSSKPMTPTRSIAPSSLPSQLQSMSTIPSYISANNHHSKAKSKSSLPLPQSFATKLSQQPTAPSNATRKSNATVQPQINASNSIRSMQQHKTPMPAHHYPQQQQPPQYRSNPPSFPQQPSKHGSVTKLPKSTATRQQPVVSSRSVHPASNAIIPPSSNHPAVASSTSIRPTATKRRTLPAVNMK